MAIEEFRERELLETQLTTLEAELAEAVAEGRDETFLDALHEQIFRVRAAFNRGCN